MSDKQNVNGQSALERAIAEVRANRVEDHVVELASQRAWERVSGTYGVSAAESTMDASRARITGCPDFQSLIPAYLAKTLPEARALLVQDHILECVACRHALHAAQSGPRPVAVGSSAKPGTVRRPIWTNAWALAAILLLGVGLGLVGIGPWYYGRGPQAVVQSVAGNLYQVSDSGSVALASGRALGSNQEIRTGHDASAVIRLTDGTKIEMSERADLWLSRGWSGDTIHLERGNIIVQAAKQHGQLQVATRDCLVSVKGTVFDVNAGTKGARVSVIEGDVQVNQNGKLRMLHPGEQLTTRAALAQVPVAQEVAWSRNSGEYLALLSEFAVIRTQIEALPGPAPRFDSTLLKLVPEDTAVYIAIPNIGESLSQANRVFEDRLQQSDVLKRWWATKQASGEAQKTEQMIDRVRAFGDYLGSEVVIAIPAGHQSPVLLSEVKRTDFPAFLQSQLGEIKGQGGPPMEIVENPAGITASSHGAAFVYLKNSVLVASPDATRLQQVSALIDGKSASGFASTAFFGAIEHAYQGGAGWLLAADVEQMPSKFVSRGEAAEARNDIGQDATSGIKDMRYLILESKDVGGQTQNRATLTFSQERSGVASWLAAPSPMGTLDFVSPKASFAVSFVVKQPRDIVQDIFNFSQNDANFSQELADFESKSGLSVRDDLAAPIGGEMTFAVDGPVLPTPSWKVAVEVNDPTRMEMAIEKLIPAVNEQPDNHAGTLGLSHETTGGRTFYELQVTPSATAVRKASDALTPTEIHYVFVDGYLLAAPSQALLLSSIQNRETGYSLTRSADFTNRLPLDGNADFSGLVYQNLWSVVGPLAEQLGSSSLVTPAQRQSIQALSQNNSPSLIGFYGEPDQIVVATTGNILGLGFESLMGMQGASPLSVLDLIKSASHQRN